MLRRHGDEVERLPGGYYIALGRCDDTMNLGGIKVHVRPCLNASPKAAVAPQMAHVQRAKQTSAPACCTPSLVISTQ